MRTVFDAARLFGAYTARAVRYGAGVQPSGDESPWRGAVIVGIDNSVDVIHSLFENRL